MGDAARRRGGAADAEISMRPAMPPVSHLMTLYQRFDSLRNSIALLREQTLHTPGIEDWPSVQARFSNLLSHMYSVASALQSPSPHFFASQLATLHEFLNTEAQASNAFEEDNAQQSHSLLYRPSRAGEVPPVHYTDADSRLPVLAVHPCKPIVDAKLNWLGTLLRTVPEVDITKQEEELVAAYDAAHASEPADGRNEAELVSQRIAEHDAHSIGALRTWYHVLHAPDSEGETYDFRMRVYEG